MSPLFCRAAVRSGYLQSSYVLRIRSSFAPQILSVLKAALASSRRRAHSEEIRSFPR